MSEANAASNAEELPRVVCLPHSCLTPDTNCQPQTRGASALWTKLIIAALSPRVMISLKLKVPLQSFSRLCRNSMIKTPPFH